MTITCNSIMKKTYTIPQIEPLVLYDWGGIMKGNLSATIEPGGGAPGRISSGEVGPSGL